MVNVCEHCGAYHADKIIDIVRGVAICPACDYANPFRFTPLFCVCGASGVGKSTVCRLLMRHLKVAVTLDADILWDDAYNATDESRRTFFEMWLRVSKNIAQAGRPVVLFNAGMIPPNIEPCVERRYFTTVHYLALTCASGVLRRRLQARPTWRESSSHPFIAEQLRFNEWLRQTATTDHRLTALDTTHDDPAVTQAAIAAWVSGHIDEA